MSALSMTRSGARLQQPIHHEADEQLIYGVGFTVQISPTQAAMIVNIRNSGVAVVDFENGWDIVVFDSLNQIRPENAIKGERNEPDIHPRSGQPLTMVKHMPIGGFVPLGAKLQDGTPHPHAGTGFGVAVAHGYPADNSVLNAHVAKDLHQYRQLVQFRYDGQNFEITRIDKLGFDEFLPGWQVTNRALSGAIADGEDLLFGLVAGSGNLPENLHEDAPGGGYGSGLSRWRYEADGWLPVEFLPINDGLPDASFEPTLIRDTDGSLLFCVRGGRLKPDDAAAVKLEETYLHFRVYRSKDNGVSWEKVIHLPNIRAASPVTILQTTSGQPFIAANPYYEGETDSQGRLIQKYSQRNRLWFWPLTPDRRDVQQPYHAMDMNEVLGAPREWEASSHDNRWYADHPIGGLFRLGDEQWHSLVSFRVSDAALNTGGAPPAPEAGTWVEEILEAEPGLDEQILAWQF